MSKFAKLCQVMCNGWVVAAVCVLGLLAFFEMENGLSSMPFTIGVFLFLSAFVFLLTRKLAFSVYSSFAVMGIISLLSFVKHKEQGFDLHAYDVVFVGGDSSLNDFLMQNYSHFALPVLFFITATVLGLAVIAFMEQPRKISFIYRLISPVVVLGLLPFTVPAGALASRHEYLIAGHHISAFFVSFIDISSLNTEKDLRKRLAKMPAPEPLSDTVSCTADNQQPDVFVVLSETQTPPTNFPQLNLSDSFADGFLSQDGPHQSLQVETFGGGTWISALSLMTGLSAVDFGWQRPYLTSVLENKVKGALPDVMARCGYRTVAILPMDYSFVNDGAFLHSIGFETVLDAADIDAEDGRYRDKVYYEATNRFIAEHRKTDKRPLFLMVQTMFPHGPYNMRLAPEEVIADEPFNPDLEMNEYLRRVHISRQDFRAFLADRRADSTERGGVLLEFGDHQAAVTKPFVEQLEGVGVLANWDSLAYKTHYTVHAFDYDFPKTMPEFDRLDIAYLGVTFAEAAGLPSSPMMDDLVSLRDSCEGRFHTCAKRNEVDKHLRRRIDGDLLNVMN